MTIIRPILRVCAMAALRDRTYAKDRVYDSDNTPLPDALTAEPSAYICVYTDDDDRTEIEGRDIISATRGLNLVLEYGIASAIEETEGGPPFRIADADSVWELGLDLLETQIIAGLFHDPQSTWGELFKEIADKVITVQSKRGGSAERGARWAARQMIITLDPLHDPVPGKVLEDDHPIKIFIAAAKAANDQLKLEGVGEMIEKMLDVLAAPYWREGQAWLALTQDEIRGIGLGPPLTGVPEIEIEGHETGLGLDPTKADEMFGEADVPRVVGDAEPVERDSTLPPWPDLTLPNRV